MIIIYVMILNYSFNSMIHQWGVTIPYVLRGGPHDAKAIRWGGQVSCENNT